jgi:agmatinase
MPATGTPVPGGLAWHYGLQLLRELFVRHQVIGADIVEVAPRPGERLTEFAAAELAYTLMAYEADSRQTAP